MPSTTAAELDSTEPVNGIRAHTGVQPSTTNPIPTTTSRARVLLFDSCMPARHPPLANICIRASAWQYRDEYRRFSASMNLVPVACARVRNKTREKRLPHPPTIRVLWLSSSSCPQVGWIPQIKVQESGANSHEKPRVKDPGIRPRQCNHLQPQPPASKW